MLFIVEEIYKLCQIYHVDQKLLLAAVCCYMKCNLVMTVDNNRQCTSKIMMWLSDEI